MGEGLSEKVDVEDAIAKSTFAGAEDRGLRTEKS